MELVRLSYGGMWKQCVGRNYLRIGNTPTSVNYRTHFVRVLFGNNRQVSILTVGSGLLLGLGAWLGYPILGVSYWLWPTSLTDWAFILGFILLAAGVSFERGGLLAAWWVNIPTHVAISHYVYSGTFVVLPFRNDFLSYLVISAEIAFLYGVIGYFLGMVSRWVFNRFTILDRRVSKYSN